MTPRRNRGAVLLQRSGMTQEQIASLCHVTQVAANHWTNAATKPSKPKRAILSEKLGIPIDSWDELPTPDDLGLPPKGKRPKKGEAAAKPADRPRTRAEKLEKMADELLDGLVSEGSMATPLERAKVMAILAPIVVQLAKLHGEYDVGTRLFKLPMWVRMRGEIVEALRPHPRILRDVVERLARIDTEFDAAVS